MSTKSFILSSAGLKNILSNQNQEDEFKFIFGEREIKMKNLFAEFISPYVSQIHQSDPTIDFIQLLNKNEAKNHLNSDLISKISEDTYSLFEALSKGNSINITKEGSLQLQIISVLLQNEELFQKLNELFYEKNSSKTEDNTEEDIHIEFLTFFHINSKMSMDSAMSMLEYSNSIKYIASHLYSIDASKIIKLPKTVFYSIVKNDSLKVKSEDSLLELIDEYFSNNQNEDEETSLNEIDFYEHLKFEYLSENKFKEFIDKFDANEMTTILWNQLKKCFYIYKKSSDENINLERYRICNQLLFDGKNENAFNGIIYNLTEKNGGNVDEKGVIKITASSVYSTLYPKHAVDFINHNEYFASKNIENSWLQYDFKNLSIHPTHYSIRSRNGSGKGNQNPKSWVIEGSNDSENWIKLDSRENVDYLDGKSVVYTFKVESSQEANNFYRFLRIRHTGLNTGNDNYLVIAALEYFGSIIENDE